MIAAWMLYCTLCAAALGGVAFLVERARLGSGGAIRHVWVVAVVLSLALPAVAYRAASRTTVPVAGPIVSANDLVGAALDRVVGAPSTVAETSPAASSSWNWRATIGVITRANQVLIIAWITLSAALALYFLVGLIALARMRRRWQPQNVLGYSVLVSDRTGPAVVGAVSPAIVMPAWALNMEPSQLALMLRHEEEHRRAKDVQLMTAAQLVLIAMPWNAALYWMMMRLGMAVELDCDARVLRDADPRSYGDLLLEVARPRRGPRLIGATAFAERAEQLERRIRAITRGRNRASRGARALAALAALAVASVAWVAPRPPVPPRVTPPKVVGPIAPLNVPQTTVVPATISASSASRRTEIGTDLAKRVVIPPVRVAETKPLSGFTPIATTPALSAPSVPAFQPSPLVDSVFSRLFAGIPLSLDQATKAYDIIAKLELRQMAQDVGALTSVLKSEPVAAGLQAHRDSLLHTLLTDDADRALFDKHLATVDSNFVPAGGGRRGRSGGGGQPAGANMVGGPRGGGPRGGGRSGGPVSVANVQLSVASTDEVYRRLFDGITLTPDQEARARAIIETTTEQFLASIPELPPTELRLVNAGRVAMRAESRDVLSALLTNDADRSLLESRTTVETRTIIKRGASQGSR